ncbi:MAG: ABC transporter substrate-binding protein [Aquabacterium sp.]|uniref:ABC transporter substrate-binding protein n=1 Tax=Aquabacterium sp. TaxID=1872578 RepID=UPI0025BCDFCE|nr:ABC transporter substrate-binding protein [Aquabacterium sp.]MBI5924736.1 ABC transporter substrate-binding protein [Aquabacterium sp.]
MFRLRRRTALLAGAGLASLSAFPRAANAQSSELMDLVLATPGPGSSVSTIPELAVKIGADRAEGVSLRLKFVGGGGIAIREVLNGNAHFGVFGATAAMNENLREPRLLALSAVENRAPLSLMVRSGLAGQVKRVQDLRGRVVGIHSNSLSTTTNGQQFLNLLLRQHGLPADSVKLVAAGQSWDTQSSALRGQVVDAVVSEEPFGLRMEQEGLAYPLVRLGLADSREPLPGEGFLRGTLIAQRSLVEAQAQAAQRMVKVIQRTLAWRKTHSAQETVTALGLSGAEASAFMAMLKQYPNQFSEDGRFSEAQIQQTDAFFRESAGASPQAMGYRFNNMIDARWAGRKP